MSFPSSFKALLSNGDGTVSVKSIPLVTNLQPHEVLIRVHSVGLNPADWKLLSRPLKKGIVIGYDAAGDVIKVGSEVKHLKIGDHVSAVVHGASSKDNGAFAEYARLSSLVTFKIPESISYNEAASLPIPHLTAAMGLYRDLQLPLPSRPTNKKDIILIWGGSTAVGHHAIQLAVQSGLRVFATASKSAHDYLKSLGVERCFDYHDEDIVDQIQTAADTIGVKYAFDTVSEGGTGVNVVDAIGFDGGKVVIVLWQTDAAERRTDVEVVFVSLHVVLGAAFKLPYNPQDGAVAKAYLARDFPVIIDGWKEGKGSAILKPQKLRVLEGGLEGVAEGLAIMAKGEYGREKLVCPIF